MSYHARRCTVEARSSRVSTCPACSSTAAVFCMAGMPAVSSLGCSFRAPRNLKAAPAACCFAQTPKKEERAAINRPKVTLLYASGQNDTLSQNLAEKLLPQPVLQASTLLAAQQYLAQFAQEMPSTSIPGEAFALLAMKRLGSSSVMMKAAGLYLEAALAPVRHCTVGGQLCCCCAMRMTLNDMHDCSALTVDHAG